MERGHKYQDGVRYFESKKRLEGARGKTGRYSPENNSSLPFRHIIPELCVRPCATRVSEYREENIGTKELEGQKDRLTRARTSGGRYILSLNPR